VDTGLEKYNHDDGGHKPFFFFFLKRRVLPDQRSRRFCKQRLIANGGFLFFKVRHFGIRSAPFDLYTVAAQTQNRNEHGVLFPRSRALNALYSQIYLYGLYLYDNVVVVRNYSARVWSINRFRLYGQTQIGIFLAFRR